MAPDDLKRLRLKNDADVRVESRRGEITLPARSSARVRPGQVFIPFHYVEAAANLLTVDDLDPYGKIPEFKFCAVRVRKVRKGRPGTRLQNFADEYKHTPEIANVHVIEHRIDFVQELPVYQTKSPLTLECPADAHPENPMTDSNNIDGTEDSDYLFGDNDNETFEAMTSSSLKEADTIYAAEPAAEETTLTPSSM